MVQALERGVHVARVPQVLDPRGEDLDLRAQTSLKAPSKPIS